MLYTYGLKIGFKLVAAGQFKRALRYLVVPVNYWRTLEYRLVYESGQFRAGDTVLDIGSPKLLSLYLAKRVKAEVYATDIEEYFIQEYSLLKHVEQVPDDRMHIQAEDGRHLSFDGGAFDKVYALSVVEHIPGEGDTECVREIARVLAPGGRCVITVPFWPTSRMEFAGADGFYWSQSSIPDADGRVFYQRRYSEEDLHSRLIRPSGLHLAKLQYVGERVMTDSPREFCEFLPPITGPLQPLLAKVCQTRPVNSWRELKKPLCALIVLEKPASPS